MKRRSLVLSLIGGSLCGFAARADDPRISQLSAAIPDLDATALDVTTLHARFLRQYQQLDQLEKRIKAARWINRQSHLPQGLVHRIVEGQNHSHGPWCVHFYQSEYTLDIPRQPGDVISPGYISTISRQVQEQLDRLLALAAMVEDEERRAQARLARIQD